MSKPGKVVVVGVKDGVVTDTGTGYQTFESLEAAREAFPDLDPESKGDRFIKGMPDSRDEIAWRFETWQAFDLYSR